MRAGAVSAAALRAAAPIVQLPPSQHCNDEAYAQFVGSLATSPQYRRQKLNHRRRFIRGWPDLNDWFAAPLVERVGRLCGEHRQSLSHRISYQARGYLLFLGLRGDARFDYDWLLGVGQLFVPGLARQMGIDLGLEPLVDEAVRLGFNAPSAYQAMCWTVVRIGLHTGDFDPRHVRAEHIEELLQAVRRFGERPDIAEFYGSAERYRESPSKGWITHLHQLQVVLFHRGQIAEQPRKSMPSYAQPVPVAPRLHAVVERWLAARALTDRPATITKLRGSLTHFMAWLATHVPGVVRWSEVTRDHVLAYLTALAKEPVKDTGRPYAVLTRRGMISALARFFRDTATWEWDEVPGRPLLGSGDFPKIPARVPRFIPADELARLMAAIAKLDCPYQRAALLVARWSGARKGEIRRLALDCLDSYPDGTPRLRLPAGKTYRERMVPLHEEAAGALREVIALRAGRHERAFIDELTGMPTRYLFLAHGKPLSDFYLFVASLRKACTAAGLVDATGHPTVSAHRFRHTVGTQLAERGAKLHTIMSVLGHRSVSMALVYAQISDPEVLKDYQAVLGPGAVLAGPGAETLRSGALPSSAIDWLKCNFFKTELELGHCLRLPTEGPCECDLYLSCAKFVTTPAYAPRLCERRRVELILAEDAQARGWPRERERHLAVAARIEQLLTDLGESLEDLTTADRR
jgi:integrase